MPLEFTCWGFVCLFVRSFVSLKGLIGELIGVLKVSHAIFWDGTGCGSEIWKTRYKSFQWDSCPYVGVLLFTGQPGNEPCLNITAWIGLTYSGFRVWKICGPYLLIVVQCRNSQTCMGVNWRRLRPSCPANNMHTNTWQIIIKKHQNHKIIQWNFNINTLFFLPLGKISGLTEVRR